MRKRPPITAGMTLKEKTEKIQLALQDRGHPLPRFGADGVYGDELADALLAELGIEAAPSFDRTAFIARHVNLNAPAITDADIGRAATRLNVSRRHIEAIRKVESGPSGSFDSKGRPVILPEPHIFSRQTRRRFDRSHPHLSYRRWGTRPYPMAFDERWELLASMAALDEAAALESASWGLFQVMGFHWSAFDHASVQDFIATMVEGEAGHLESVVAFIEANGLKDELYACRADDPQSCIPFVRAYNGPGYARNNYHKKFARALR